MLKQSGRFEVSSSSSTASLTGQVVLQRRADDPLARQHDDAGALLLVAQLLLAHHHAVALDAAQAGLLELEAVLEHGAAERHGDGVAGLEVVGAADDLPHAAVGLADLDGAQAELVGVGVLLAGQHLADDEAAEVLRVARGADPVDALHLGAGHGEQLRELLHRALPVDVLLEPAERYAHLVRLLSELPQEADVVVVEAGAGRGCRA